MCDYMAAKMDDQITGAISENERLAAENESMRSDLARKDAALVELRADRDEWRLQHENLLAVRHSDLTALTKSRDEWRDSSEEWRKIVAHVGYAPCGKCGYVTPEKRVVDRKPKAIVTFAVGKFRCVYCECLWQHHSNKTWSLYDGNQKPCRRCDNHPDFLGVILPAPETKGMRS